MDKMIYLAMTGAKQMLKAQAVNANNLANINTTGFRADLAILREQALQGGAFDSRVYSRLDSAGIDLRTGTIQQTGNELDIAIEGDGFIAVQAPDGSEAYTRAGNLQLTASGQLVTGGGYPVLGNGGPIAVPPHAKLDIGADGTISVQPLGQEVTSLSIIDRIKLVNAEGERLVKDEYGLLRPASGNTLPADAGVTVTSGALETSNVNAVEAMVQMIDLARQYEMHIKMMKTAEENDSSSAKLLGMS